MTTKAGQPSLQLWQTYTREAVHDIFEPDTTFTPQTGKWGLPGIVKVGNDGDFVFFVTFGSSQGDHDFDEEITEDGVFTWQSQPRQRLDSPVIQTLIAHDDLVQSIHLFLRTKKGVDYTYFGQLGYLEHDPQREQPVYFTWQLMDWPPPKSVLASLNLMPSSGAAPTAPPAQSNTLIETPPPVVGAGRDGSPGGGKKATLPGQDAKNRALGKSGEALVLKMETEKLKFAGRDDLAAKVVHTAVVEGDSAGYDIRSFNVDGTDRHIEVKTTKGPAANAFFISPNELDFGDKHPSSYVIVRVYKYDEDNNSGHFFELAGSPSASLSLTASEYRARLMPSPPTP